MLIELRQALISYQDYHMLPPRRVPLPRQNATTPCLRRMSRVTELALLPGCAT